MKQINNGIIEDPFTKKRKLKKFFLNCEWHPNISIWLKIKPYVGLKVWFNKNL
jgi:hypothetical protein